MSAHGHERESASSSMDLNNNPASPSGHEEDTKAGALGPSGAQRRYLEGGLEQAGGKLPLFDRDGREVPKKTVQACIAHGWAEAWTRNPIKPEWLVCRLTAAGYQILGRTPPARDDAAGG